MIDLSTASAPPLRSPPARPAAAKAALPFLIGTLADVTLRGVLLSVFGGFFGNWWAQRSAARAEIEALRQETSARIGALEAERDELMRRLGELDQVNNAIESAAA